MALVAALWLAMLSHAAGAGGASEQFHRSRWYPHDNAPADIWSMIQDRDGYLLLGTGSGLYRFDGANFQRYALPSGKLLPSHNITAMTQLPSGGIWLGYYSGGAGLIQDGHLISYSTDQGFPDATVFNFSRTNDGTLWATTTDGLVRFAHGHWTLMDASWNYPEGTATWSLVDQEGNLWVSGDKRLMLLRKDSSWFLDTRIDIGREAVFAQAQDGTLWLSDELNGIRALPNVTAKHPQLTELVVSADKSLVAAKRMVFDRSDQLWVTDARRGGVFVVADPRLVNDGRPLRLDDASLIVRKKDGLTADIAVPLMQDSEGTIWVGTNLGLNNFRRNNVKVPDDLLVGPSSHVGLGAGPDGTVWIINAGTLSRAESGNLVAVMEGLPDLDGVQVGMGNVLWFSRNQDLFSLVDGRLSALPPVDSGLKTSARAMAADLAGGLWVSFRNRGIRRFSGGRWSRSGVESAVAGSDAISIAAESVGRVWFGYSDDRLVLLDGSDTHLFSAGSGLHVGNVATINAAPGDVLIGGGSGLARFRGGAIQSITAGQADVLSGISGIVRSANGDVWINGSRGVVHIQRADLDAAFEQPDEPLQYGLFDYDAGLPGIAIQESPSPTATADRDGRLWFSTNQGLAWIDPRDLHLNSVPPPVNIQSLTAMGKTWFPSMPIHLPEHTSNVQIAYTALSLSIPKRVRFRYRLLGVDDQWQEVGDRRNAFYTNLTPGKYHFHVIAANADGVWNTQGATIDFTIRPTFYQTSWFLLLCLAMLAGTFFALYLLRLRQLTLRVHERLHERHLERERIARELHDTLLQSVQGLVLRFQVAAEQLPPESPTRQTLEQALDRGDDVLVEARDRVRDLRALTNGVSSLSRALAEAGEELEQGTSTHLRVITEGVRRNLNPTIYDEAYRIGREALTNALAHARASSIEIEINYDPDFLRVRVRDDGIGIEQDLLDARTRSGHWGLAGMRERAARIGATLDIWGGEGVGTEVALKVPASLAYCDGKSRYRNWLRRLVSGGRYG